MPKLKERPEVAQDKLFKGLISKYMTIGGYEVQELADKLRIHRVTLHRKLEEPDRFTREELRQLFQILKFSPEEKSMVM